MEMLQHTSASVEQVASSQRRIGRSGYFKSQRQANSVCDEWRLTRERGAVTESLLPASTPLVRKKNDGNFIEKISGARRMQRVGATSHGSNPKTWGKPNKVVKSFVALLLIRTSETPRRFLPSASRYVGQKPPLRLGRRLPRRYVK